MASNVSQIGRGVYTIAETSRMTNIPTSRIRRWTRGYRYRRGQTEFYSPPAVAADFPQIEGAPALTFNDLVEVRFLDAFLDYGVTWKVLRIALERAQELLGRHHPFSTRMFVTDGRTILADIVGSLGNRKLLDLVRNQYAFESIIQPYLYTGLDYNKLNEPERWWPLGKNRSVVVDPKRAFGAPIVVRGGVPTRVLAQTAHVEDSIQQTAQWYEVEAQEVQDALDYEELLAA